MGRHLSKDGNIRNTDSVEFRAVFSNIELIKIKKNWIINESIESELVLENQNIERQIPKLDSNKNKLNKDKIN